MRQVIARVGGLVLLVVGLSAGSVMPADATHEPTLITSKDNSPSPSSFRFETPGTDGQFVAWIHRVPETRAVTIKVARFDERPSPPTMSLEGGETTTWYRIASMAIGDGIVAWLEDHWADDGNVGAVWARNLHTGEEYKLSKDPITGAVAVAGQRVAWVTADPGTGVDTLKVAELSATPSPVAITESETDLTAITIAGDRIFWLQAMAGAPDNAPAELWMASLAGGEPSMVTQASAYDVVGNTLVYVLNGTLTAVDLATGQTTTIASQASQPTTDGRFVFWAHGTRILGYDLASASSFTAASIAAPTNDDDHLTNPSARSGVLIWERAGIGSSDSPAGQEIHAATISDRLPLARQAEPGTTSPDWTYFPETGHYLSFGFQIFWERSGGLPVFGYPLTEEFSERNADTGQFHAVQYLERQRYEYHPQHAGTPYEVQLGRLGAEDAAKRGLLDAAAFQPLPGAGQSADGCHFFPETGHRLCAGFRAYWEAHGLEFGDPGVSYRESLALFGYPLSEEYTDPETGLVTQYFERARFEYHPDNPAEHRVLLGRLGADLIAERGW